MVNSIFFSWQSDTPTLTGRNFLRKVLEKVCEEISDGTSIDEALRNELVVDSDTQGEAGQPPITETIFKKIDAAAVFVADMTFTGKRIDERPTPNANVLIEYGWALKSLKHTRIISVMNEVYGKASRESLPFDLAYARWPIRFSLADNATVTEKNKVELKLIKDLKAAICLSLETVPTQSLPLFSKAAPKNGPARFRKVGEEIGYYEGWHDQPALKVFLREGPAMWLRVMPSAPTGRIWTPRELKEIAQNKGGGLIFLPLTHGRGLDWLRAEDGWGIYSSSNTKDKKDKQIEILNIAFAFQTGEIWSVDTALLDWDLKRIPSFEKYFNNEFNGYIHFLEALGVIPPYHWAAGITGIKGRQLISVGQSGPLCLSDTIEDEGIYKNGLKPSEALRPFYEKVFEKCGIKRPDNLS